jgi:hypothetical protein
MYDLVLAADATPPDTSRHSVRVLPAYRTDFYFAQISDTHLPEHTFSTPGAGFSVADTSGFPDFNAVAADLNLIHPEFILHTGDLVNEGELEDWLAMYEMSRAKAALSRLRDPIFVVSGNHDIGGWDASPPPDGTARRNWWKLFGWPYLDAPPAGDPVHHQNFGFDYGNLHVVGLETYINNGSYDGFRIAQYGAQSFAPEQMNWLTQHLAALPPGTRKLLFYHYDFGGTLGNGSPGANFSQINPTTLGVDGVIWGHNHGVAEGNRTAKPFNLGLQSVIDGRRTFRYLPLRERRDHARPDAPRGHHARLAVPVVERQQRRHGRRPHDHDHQPLQRVVAERAPGLPHEPGLAAYVATNGTVVQELDHDGMHDVYVEFTLPASGTIPVRVEGTYPLDVPTGDLAARVLLAAPAPNPAPRGSRATIAFTLPAGADDLDLAVFDVTGRGGSRRSRGARWERDRTRCSGMAPRRPVLYFVRLRALGATRVSKLALLP